MKKIVSVLEILLESLRLSEINVYIFFVVPVSTLKLLYFKYGVRDPLLSFIWTTGMFDG